MQNIIAYGSGSLEYIKNLKAFVRSLVLPQTESDFFFQRTCFKTVAIIDKIVIKRGLIRRRNVWNETKEICCGRKDSDPGKTFAGKEGDLGYRR